jgi:hypothetical protein
VDHEKNFDNPMYNVNASGGQVILGQGWSRNPTYKDSDRAAQQRESNCARDSSYGVYGNVTGANPFDRLSEVQENDDK